MRKFLIAICIIANYAYPTWAIGKNKPKTRLPGSPWQGVVTYVSDGDTVFVRPASGAQPVKIRIDGVDAPEICQAYGPASQQALQARVLHQTVSVDAHRRDSYGRVLARISWRQADVGAWMVSQGHAWSYRYRRDAGPYTAQEAKAKAAQRGLFADAQALQPRDFRKRHGSCHEGSAKLR